MMNTVDLGLTGMVACIVDKGVQLPKDIGDHPQVALFDGAEQWPTGAVPPLPPELRAIAYVDTIQLQKQQALQNEAKRRGIPYVPRHNAASLSDILRQWIATSKRPAEEKGAVVGGKRQIAEKGAIKHLVIDNPPRSEESNAQAARRLADIAKSKGIVTTLSSIEQAVGVYRRNMRHGAKPESAVPQAERERLQVLKTLEDSIAGLQLTLDWISKVEAENADLRAFKARILDISKAASG
jgi:hypothetical protein